MTDMFCRDGVRMKVGVRRCHVGKNLGSDVIIFLSDVISPHTHENQPKLPHLRFVWAWTG